MTYHFKITSGVMNGGLCDNWLAGIYSLQGPPTGRCAIMHVAGGSLVN